MYFMIVLSALRAVGGVSQMVKYFSLFTVAYSTIINFDFDFVQILIMVKITIRTDFY